MADFVQKQNHNSQKEEKKPFRFDIKNLLFITIGLVSLNLFISYYLFISYTALIKPIVPLDLQVKQALQTQKDLYKMTEKIKKISNGKLEEE